MSYKITKETLQDIEMNINAIINEGKKQKNNTIVNYGEKTKQLLFSVSGRITLTKEAR